MTTLNGKMFDLLDEALKTINRKLGTFSQQEGMDVDQMADLVDQLEENCQYYQDLLELDEVETSNPDLVECQQYVKALGQADARQFAERIEELAAFIAGQLPQAEGGRGRLFPGAAADETDLGYEFQEEELWGMGEEGLDEDGDGWDDDDDYSFDDQDWGDDSGNEYDDY